ncbi:ABC transporter substrate-binding protein [Rathayibacter sp. VKM Ac-2927]|uniref:ABC transporter substrate-binding protein n=1 Tax=Rathayibacter sp. VKM Ac-2927 TaxID=2929478 RepID=UPI001FB35084|nr:extracellular solute-binding protein [Rathayibacter sp. VKM Ac-2927]MCJ1688371.1 extracellular solute-binding protein [Rathayibacter sp. VKM Ac-2927]
MTPSLFPSSAFSRRGFLGAAGGAAALATLTACSGGGGASSGGDAITFWDMPWGNADYNPAAQKIAEAYAPTGSELPAEYQVIQWNNFTQTFSSAIASKTGPAVSTGGGFQAFQYAEQGAIAYADDLLETFKGNGVYDDFLPGIVEPFKTANGYAAVPNMIDMRIWWYRKSIFDELGLTPPTTWEEYLTTGKALAAKGYFAYGIGAGAGNNIGAHSMVVMMINNGGGLFNADNELDCVSERNIETVDFLTELAREKIIDPASVSYTIDNGREQWKSGKVAMGISTPGLNDDIGDTDDDVLVATPMAGLHGDVGTLQFLNNMMMYTNTPSQESSEAFMSYWFQNYGDLWKQRLIPALPVLKSVIALPEFQENAQKVKILDEWQPIAKTYAATGDVVDAKIAAIDGGQALNAFTQTVLGGQADSKSALEKLQKDIEAL